MVKQVKLLLERFVPKKYELHIEGNNCRLHISGKKLPPPSKRIVLHAKKIKITSASIIQHTKKGDVFFEIERINILPSFEQVRLHASSTLFPGDYSIELTYELSQQQLKTLNDKSARSRIFLPCVDEPEAWRLAELETKVKS